jgi:pyrroline-5-carboxylate reductase
MTMSSDTALSGALLLLGAGKMGGAMLHGWLDRGIPPARIIVLDPSPPAEIAHTIARHGIRHNPALADVERVEVLVLAIKPQNFDEVLPALAGLKSHCPLVLSIAAGRTMAGIERHFGDDAPVIRAMPNVPAAIGRGITAMVANPNVSASQLGLAQLLLQAIGEVVRVEDEGLMDAVTAVSGSGPAYVFLLIECLAEAARAAGLPDDIASRLARATVTGAAELAHLSEEDAAELRRQVTSPGGTTAAALEVLTAAGGLRDLMTRAVAAAAARSRALAD